MKSISRYIFRQLLTTTTFVAVVLTIIVSLFGSLRLVDFIINRGLPVSVLFELIAFRVPGFLAIVLPLAIVAAILSVYNRLSTDSELVVMRASGVSQWTLATPGIVLALLTMALSFPLNFYVSPLMYSNFKAQQIDYRNAFSSILLQEQNLMLPAKTSPFTFERERGPENVEGFLRTMHEIKKNQSLI